MLGTSATGRADGQRLIPPPCNPYSHPPAYQRLERHAQTGQSHRPCGVAGCLPPVSLSVAERGQTRAHRHIQRYHRYLSPNPPLYSRKPSVNPRIPRVGRAVLCAPDPGSPERRAEDWAPCLLEGGLAEGLRTDPPSHRRLTGASPHPLQMHTVDNFVIYGVHLERVWRG